MQGCRPGRRRAAARAASVVAHALACLMTALVLPGLPATAFAQGRGPAVAPRPSPTPRPPPRTPRPPKTGEPEEGSDEGDGSDEPTPHPAAAIAKDEEEEAPPIVPKFATGFVMLTSSFQAIPRAVPRNRYDASLFGIAGVAAVGQPAPKWDYLAYVLALVSTSAVNGTSGGITPEQITLRYTPTKPLSFTAGWMRMPFSLSQSSVIFTSMFPTRPEATTLFYTGADAGLLAAFESEIVHAKAGLYDGSSLGLTTPQLTTRGPVTTVNLEVTPLGAMPALEADFGATPFRFGVALSGLHRASRAFEPRGYEALEMTDVRFGVSLRASYRGLFAQGEYLQSIQTDDLSRRTRITRGAYGEGSAYFPIKKALGLSPVARLSWSVQDGTFFPLHVIAFQSGIALYPRADLPDPSVLRFILQYRTERRVEELEVAHGVLFSGMYRF